MIDIVNLSKSFIGSDGNEFKVLKNINCHISEGEVVSIIGPSGVGKSTLLRCINGLETASEGHILFDGQDVCSHDADLNAIRQKMGIVFQSFNLFEHMTVLENVTFGPMKLLGKSKKEAEEKAMALLRQVGMADKANEYPSTLSGGQKQRAAIARCLGMDPKCILFDEPTSALDPTMVGEVLAVINQLAHQGLTMIIVTHEMKFASDVSTRVLFMYDNGIYEDGTPEQIFHNPQKQETMAFINRLKTIHYDFDSHDADLYSLFTDIKKFCFKYELEDKINALSHICEELLFEVLTDVRPVTLDILYSEMDFSLRINVFAKGVKECLLSGADQLTNSIIKGLSKRVEETVTDNGLLIEIGFTS